MRLEDGFIEVKAQKAKTSARRLVPIQENLAKWLLLCPEKTGKVVPFGCVGDQLIELCKATGEQDSTTEKTIRAPMVWKRNGLRHSFINYRVAKIQNVAQVALEAGNSAQIIFSNYRELVRPSDATEWFSIEPQNERIIPLPKVA